MNEFGAIREHVPCLEPHFDVVSSRNKYFRTLAGELFRLMLKKVGYEKEILKDPLVSISCTVTAVVCDCLKNKAGGSLVLTV